MDFNRGNISHNLRLMRIEVEFANQPIARDATLRLKTLSAPHGSHFMEIHIDGKIMARWDLDLLVNQLSKEAREVSCKFRSNVKDKVLQLVLPLPLPLSEDRKQPSSSVGQRYPDGCPKIIRLYFHTYQDFHTAVAYLSKDAGFSYIEMQNASSRKSSFPRAQSAMDFHRPARDLIISNNSRSQGSVLPPVRHPSRSPFIVPGREDFLPAPPRHPSLQSHSSVHQPYTNQPLRQSRSPAHSYSAHISYRDQRRGPGAVGDQSLPRRGLSDAGNFLARSSTAQPYFRHDYDDDEGTSLAFDRLDPSQRDLGRDHSTPYLKGEWGFGLLHQNALNTNELKDGHRGDADSPQAPISETGRWRPQSPAPTNLYDSSQDALQPDWQSTITGHFGGNNPASPVGANLGHVERDDVDDNLMVDWPRHGRGPAVVATHLGVSPRNTVNIAGDSSSRPEPPSKLASRVAIIRPVLRHGSYRQMRELIARPPSAQTIGSGDRDLTMSQKSERVSSSEAEENRLRPAVKRRPASRQARSQATAKKARKTDQVEQVREPKISRNFSGDIQEPHAAPAEETQTTRKPESKNTTLIQRSRPTQRAAPNIARTDEPSQVLAASPCTRCRRKKQKCSRSKPMCEACARSAVSACVYPGEWPDTALQDHHVLNVETCSDNSNANETIAEDGSAGYPAGAPERTPSQISGVHVQVLEAAPENVKMVDSGTNPWFGVSDAGVQTDGPERLRMDLNQWKDLVQSGLGLEQAHQEKVVQLLSKNAHSVLDDRERLLITTRFGMEYEQGLLDLLKSYTKCLAMKVEG